MGRLGVAARRAHRANIIIIIIKFIIVIIIYDHNVNNIRWGGWGRRDSALSASGGPSCRCRFR